MCYTNRNHIEGEKTMDRKPEKWIIKDERGRRPGQKYKSLLVMQYILKNADDENAVTMDEILNHLAKYGIEAERRSVYRDIHDLVELMNAEQEDGSRIKERDKLNYEITFTRKPHKDAPNGGYLVTARPYEFDELRLLAECINSARFLSENQARNLRRTISGLCSKEQAKLLNTDSTVVNRSKTANKSVMASISTINQAIRHGNQIAFKYLSYSFDNMRTQVERRSGKVYVVNPYKLLIDNGFFYLMTYNGTKPIIYRIDRMKDVKELLTAREWEKEFRENVDIDNYTKRVFSMFGGKRERVTIRFIDQRLDTVVDQFGIAGAKYEKVDEGHFTVTTEVELSDMFYAWIFGFGRRAKIIDPPYVADKMREYCQKIAEMYELK